MLKKILIALVVAALAISAGILYLNRVFLPRKIKAEIVKGLQEATGKEVSLDAVRVNIFKGLVLSGLSISDAGTPLASVKEASCAIFIPAIFQKKIIIPWVRIVSPRVFVQRKQDGSFNFQELAGFKPAQPSAAKFQVLVLNVAVRNGIIDFQDDSLAQQFKKSLSPLDLNAAFSLPAGVKFKLTSGKKNSPDTLIASVGSYSLTDKELKAKISIVNFNPSEFAAYYQQSGVSFPKGKVDGTLILSLKGDRLNLGYALQSRELLLAKDKLIFDANAAAKGSLSYGLADKALAVSGEAQLAQCRLSGVEFIGEISRINGKVKFNQSGLFADKLSASALGIPFEAALKLDDFTSPRVEANLSAAIDLAQAKNIISEKFKLSLDAEVNGQGRLFAQTKFRLPLSGAPDLSGYLDLAGASVRPGKSGGAVEAIKGRVEFSADQLKWQGLNFQYSGAFYQSSGTLTNFRAPGVRLELTADNLKVNALLELYNRKISVAALAARYYNSKFSFNGDVYFGESDQIQADGKGDADLELKDAQLILPRFKEQLDKIKPEGQAHLEYRFNGNIFDLKSCSMQLAAASPLLGAYGFKARDVALKYDQADGICDISVPNAILYDGQFTLAAKMNLNSENFPFWLELYLQGLKIEKLKLDTAARNEQLSGTLQLQAKLNGFSDKLDKLSGTGRVLVTDGRLWQLNLFKGLGEIIFVKDFSDIVFSEASCSFSVQDKQVFSDNLKLRSSLADIYGPLSVGFDGALDGALEVQVNAENAPLTGTLKDIFTTVVGQATKFGVISVGGTLKEPKLKFKTAVVDILNSIKDVFIRKKSE